VALFKQIPDIGFIKIDPATKRLVGEGVPNIINPFDLHAVEAALEMRDRFGGSVYAITMGPPAFKQSADEVLSMGVDEVIHLSDRAFAGSDTLATSRALALAIKKFAGAELGAVFAGKYSWDGETGHVGPQVAELLGIPHVSGVVSLEADPPRATAVREVEDGVERVEVDLPAVFTVTARPNKPRTQGRADVTVSLVGGG
jgi:electron transfer flavoprotein beta subunit